MIITKKRFNLTPGYKGKWPFTVPEVTVLMFMNGNEKVFALIHKFGGFALSGVLENHGFDKLEKAGIWAAEPKSKTVFGETATYYKSLTPFFEFVQAVAVAELGVKKT